MVLGLGAWNSFYLMPVPLLVATYVQASNLGPYLVPLELPNLDHRSVVLWVFCSIPLADAYYLSGFPVSGMLTLFKRYCEGSLPGFEVSECCLGLRSSSWQELTPHGVSWG